MDNLEHWDFAEQFSGYDAAALILGMEPRESDTEQHKVRVVTERMALDYKNTIAKSLHLAWGEPERFLMSTETIQLVEFSSVQLEKLSFEFFQYDAEVPYHDWLQDLKRNRFDYQEFSRSTIVNWLKDSRQKSIYRFDRGATDHLPIRSGRWPWGDHHTEALGHLEAAALRFWVNYDPSDATTANTNATIVNWLQDERKVSGKLAEAIASMLRADGLRTGPRK